MPQQNKTKKIEPRLLLDGRLCRHWQKPYMQRYCVRILLMVPIYGIQSWCALIFHEKAFILESLREMVRAGRAHPRGPEPCLLARGIRPIWPPPGTLPRDR